MLQDVDVAVVRADLEHHVLEWGGLTFPSFRPDGRSVQKLHDFVKRFQSTGAGRLGRLLQSGIPHLVCFCDAYGTDHDYRKGAVSSLLHRVTSGAETPAFNAPIRDQCTAKSRQ